MKSQTALCVALCLCSTLPGWAETKMVSQSVEQWIQQLGHRSFQKREQAEATLRSMGRKILPALEKAATDSDIEIRRRATELAKALANHISLDATRITLDDKKRTIQEMLDSIRQQTGYRIHYNLSEEDKTRFSLPMNNVPFWEAMDYLCHKGGLLLQSGYSDVKIRLMKSDIMARFVDHEGPFRIEANHLSEYRSLNLQVAGNNAQPRGTGNLTLSLYLHSEPRLPILGTGKVTLDTAIDSGGVTMLPEPQFEEMIEVIHHSARYGNGYPSSSARVSVNLERPATKANAIKLIRGTVPVTLLVSQKQVTLFDSVLESAGKKVRHGDIEFHLEKAEEREKGRYRFKLTIRNLGTLNPNDYSWLNTLNRRLVLFDGKGREYLGGGTNWLESSARHVTMLLAVYTAGDDDLGPPKRLIFSDWKTKQHSVKFTLKDIPLP